MKAASDQCPADPGCCTPPTRDCGLDRDDLKASALVMFGARLLERPGANQARTMIDDMLETSGKTKMPDPVIKPLYTKFPPRAAMAKPRELLPPPVGIQVGDKVCGGTVVAVGPTAADGVHVVGDVPAPAPHRKPLPRAFATLSMAPEAVVHPPFVRVQRPSTKAATSKPERQVGGYGKLAPAQYVTRSP